jgi:hypothetical protein
MKTLIKLTKTIENTPFKLITADQKINYIIEAIGLIEYYKSKGITNHFNN